MKYFKFYITAIVLFSLTLLGANSRISKYDEFIGSVFTGGTFTGTTVDGGNLRISGNSLTSTDTDGDIIANPDGSGGFQFFDLTASTVPYLDASKYMTSSAVTPTELGYVSGVTSALQTQLDAKIDDFSGSTDNVILRSDGAGGNAIQETGVTISDTDQISNVIQLDLITEGELRLQDLAGGEYMGFKAPSTVTSSTTLTLPDGAGSNGEFLKTNGTDTLSWGSPDSSLTLSTETGTSFTASTGYLYLIDTTSNDVTSNLPTAVGADGEIISFKLIDDTNKLIVDGSTTETIDSTLTYELRSADESVTLRSDGANWIIVSSYLNELVESSASVSNYTITADQWGDLTSISLALGEWDIDLLVLYKSNGATTTGGITAGTGTVSGNTGPGVEGVAYAFEAKSTTTGTRSTLTFFKKGITVTGTTTYYLKTYTETSITNLQAAYRISARRVK